MSKNYGPVSGYLDPTNKSWEQITWRNGRPVLDKELNLAGELFLQQRYRNGTLCSGFIFSRDFFSPDIFPVGSSYIEQPGNFARDIGSGVVANKFYFGPCQTAHVANMVIDLLPKNEDWVPITLPAAPSGIGVKRWDLVFIEVWRGALTGSTSTDTTAGTRDSAGKIFYNGWVDSPTGDNFTDDVLDSGAGAETSRRVQIQWRIRVVQGVDPVTYSDALDDTVVFAQGPGSVISSSNFVSNSDQGDPGLWVSSGHATTVDGNIYAIPLCLVSRRNQNAWDKDLNQNGGSGITPTGSSYTDILEEDIIDLRKTVSDQWNFDVLLKKNLSWLLDGKLKTNFEDTGLGGGVYGTSFTQIDEISTIDTPGATRISQPDGYRRHFSDAITENVVYLTVGVSDRITFSSSTVWQAGDSFSFTLPVSSDGLFTRIFELGLLSGYSSTDFIVSGYNTKTITITLLSDFDSIPSGSRTSTSLFIKVGVVYEGNSGLSRTPHLYQSSIETGSNFTSLDVDDNLIWQTSPPSGMSTSGLDSDSLLYKPSRTATLIVNYVNTNYSVYSRTTATTVIPDEVRSVQGIYDAISDPGKTTNLYLGISGENVIQHSVVPATHREMIVDYTSKKPVPSGSKLLILYKTPSQQSLNVGTGGLNVTTAKIHILHTPDWVYTSSAGSGSHNPGYPYVSPMQQIPSCATLFSEGDHLLNYGQPLNVDDFGTQGQFIRLSVKVPLADVPFFDFKNPGQDDEYRNYYKNVETTPYDDIFDGVATEYQPSVFSQRLQASIPHRVIYPCIGLCVEDTNLGKRGTLLLVVFTRTSSDDQNSIVFDSSSDGDSCVSLYRLKGNPILSPRKYLLGHNLI